MTKVESGQKDYGDEDDVGPRVVPDGGWGWVIVGCSFLIHLFVVGTLYALSVLYVSWLQAFHGGKGYTSWILSLAVAVMFGIGPLPAALAKRIGNKKVVVVGGLLMSAGFLASVFASNVMYLICSVGIVTGVGAGFCYLPSVSMVAMYFNKKRSIAMGISASGLGVGAFLMPLYLNWMVEHYTWRGCMLLLSGLSLNMCVLGLLMHPLESAPVFGRCNKDNGRNANSDEDLFPSTFYEVDVDSLDEYDEDCMECSRDDSRSFLGACRQPPVIHILSSGGNEVEIKVHDITPRTKLPHYITPQSASGSNSRKSSLCNSNTSKHVTCSTKDGKFQDRRLSVLKRDPVVGGSLQHIKPAGINMTQKTPTLAQSLVLLPRNREEASSLSSLSGMQIMMAGSLYNAVHSSRVVKSLRSLQRSRSCTGVNEYKIVLDKSGKYGDHLSECVSGSESHRDSVVLESQTNHTTNTEHHQTVTTPKKHTLRSKIMASLGVYIDLIQHGTFMLFCLSNFLTNLSFFMPVLYMVDRAMNEGFSKSEAAMLVSLYGVGNICGKLFFGWLADRSLVDRLIIYVGCLAVCGTTTSLSPLCGSSHLLHSAYSFSFGCFIGSYCTLFPIVTVDLVGLDVVDESFGILLCFMGVATAFGAPLAGWIFDWTGSYVIAFVLHGVFILISALMLVPLAIIRSWKKVW